MRRAYGSEPVLLDTSPVTAALAVKRAKARRRQWLIAAGGALAVVFVASSLLIWKAAATADSIPKEIRQSVNFPLYAPKQLPDGFKLDNNSFKTNSQIVTFSITYGDRKLAVTEQAKPPGIDFDMFGQQFSGQQNLATDVGPATFGRFEDADLASIVTNRTWILVRAPDGIESAQFEQLLQSFR